MPLYTVVTPPFLYHEIIVDGQGPYYEQCDVVEIIAKNRKDAVALAVNYMLKHKHKYEYVREQLADRRSPYTGVKAYCKGEHWDNQNAS